MKKITKIIFKQVLKKTIKKTGFIEKYSFWIRNIFD